MSAGKPIGREDLFRYTNGHFLVNEDQQLSRRYVKFNVEELCKLVTSVAGDKVSRVCNINKMEGGFNKALLITLESGREVIAKTPCPNAGRAAYNTASEAAVLEYGNRFYVCTLQFS